MGDSEFACSVPSVVNELKGARLGDVRLEKRVVNIVERLSASPGKSLPDALQTDAELEGFYRLVGNERVSYEALASAHIAQTVERIVADGTALAIHDTTECAFSGEKERTGLGPLKDGNQGFLAHVTLAVGAQEGNMPLGVLGIECWARKEEKRPKKKGKKKMSGSDYAGIADKESARWGRQVDAAEEAVGGRASLVHVMDREGDAYPLLCGMAESAMRFVVRLARERSVWEVDKEGMALDDEDPIRMSEALLELPMRVEREVTLSTRRQSSIPRQERTHPGRQMRAATLGIGARRLALRRPKYLPELPEALEANIVYVREIDPPVGSDPVAWVLVTGEPIDTRDVASHSGRSCRDGPQSHSDCHPSAKAAQEDARERRHSARRTLRRRRSRWPPQEQRTPRLADARTRHTSAAPSRGWLECRHRLRIGPEGGRHVRRMRRSRWSKGAWNPSAVVDWTRKWRRIGAGTGSSATARPGRERHLARYPATSVAASPSWIMIATAANTSGPQPLSSRRWISL
jgi:Transposase DNA-binding